MRAFGLLGFLLAVVTGCSTSASPSPRPDPCFEPAELAAARVSRAGAVETGGLWARHRTVLLTSFDGRGTWQRWPGDLPIRDGVLGPGLVVWDSRRAWVVESASTVARTTDGGETWLSATLPGECLEWTGLAFASADHGYLVCLVGDGASDFVMETLDGGVTWSTANGGARTASGWFGTHLAASGASDVWAAAIEQENGTEPLLAGSRDGGRTWFEVSLPGVGATYHGGGTIEPIGPPVVDGGRLAVAAYDRSGGDGRIRIWESADSGATWSEVRSNGPLTGGRVAFVTPDLWVAEDRRASEIHRTLDAGRTWESFPTEGLTNGTRYGLTFATAMDGMIVAEAPDGDLMEPLVLFVTRDGGRTWRLARLDPQV
jgi:photosystem II stability/assembly factor-like uncharacterized protein